MLFDRRAPRTSGRNRVVQIHEPTLLHEPTLRETLADPIMQAVMRADGVDARELEAMLMGVLARRGGASPHLDHPIDGAS